GRPRAPRARRASGAEARGPPHALRQPPAAVAREEPRALRRRRGPHRHGRRRRAGPARHPPRRRDHHRPGRGEQRRLRNAPGRPGPRRRAKRGAPRCDCPADRRALHGDRNPMTETTAGPKKKRSMNLLTKIFVLVIGLLVLFAAVISAVEVTYFRGVLRKEALGRGKAISTTLASGLVDIPDSAIATTIASVKRDAGLAYVEVVNPNGVVIAHTFDGKLPTQDPKVLREGEQVSDTSIDGRPVIDVPATVITGAIVHVGIDPEDASAKLREAQFRLWEATLLSLFGAAVVALYMGRQIVRPLRSLTSAARRIVDGDLTAPIFVTSDDEVGELSAAFQQMVAALKEVP